MRTSFLLALAATSVVAACTPATEKDDTAATDDTGADTATDTASDTATDTATDTSDTSGGGTFEHEGGTLDGGAVWEAGTHTVHGSLTITGGVLEIPACTTILMDPGTLISVRDGGALHAVGTAQCPVAFLSSKGSPAAGDWSYIEFLSSSDGGNNVLEHVNVLHAGGSYYGAVCVDAGASVSFHASSIRESGDRGLQAVQGAELRDFTENSFTDNADVGVELGANEADQVGAGTYGPNGVEGIRVLPATVDHDASWIDPGTRWLADDGFTVGADRGSALLTVEAGATLALGPDANVSVRDLGGLTLDGTAGDPVTVESAKAAPAAGDWGYIELYAGSQDGGNRFTHAVIRHGGGSYYGAVWVDSGASLAMTDSEVSQSANYGIQVVQGGALRDFSGNTVVDNDLAPLQIGANLAGAIDVGTYAPNGIEAIELLSEYVDRDATWRHLEVPWRVAQRFNITTSGRSATVTVAAGATVEMDPGTGIDVSDNGALILAGTSTEHVRITSSKSAPAAGDWTEIDVYGSSLATNRFTYADISYGGGGYYGQLWVDQYATVTLDHATFSNGADCDVSLVAGNRLSASSSTYTVCTP